MDKDLVYPSVGKTLVDGALDHQSGTNKYLAHRISANKYFEIPNGDNVAHS